MYMNMKLLSVKYQINKITSFLKKLNLSSLARMSDNCIKNAP